MMTNAIQKEKEKKKMMYKNLYSTIHSIVREREKNETSFMSSITIINLSSTYEEYKIVSC